MVILVPERYPSHEGSSTRWVVLIMFLSTVQLFLSQSLPKAPSPSRAHPPKCPPHTLLFQALQETSLLVAFDARVCLSGKRARLNTQNPDFCGFMHLSLHADDGTLRPLIIWSPQHIADNIPGDGQPHALDSDGLEITGRLCDDLWRVNLSVRPDTCAALEEFMGAQPVSVCRGWYATNDFLSRVRWDRRCPGSQEGHERAKIEQ